MGMSHRLLKLWREIKDTHSLGAATSAERHNNYTGLDCSLALKLLARMGSHEGAADARRTLPLVAAATGADLCAGADRGPTCG